MSGVNVFVPVAAVFPGVQTDIATFVGLLGTLSRTDVVFWCARLNHVITNASDLPHNDRQAFGVREFFTIDETRLINRFARNHMGEITVFFRGSLLEIIRWAVLACHDHPTDGRTFEDPEVRRTFAKVALIASEMWGSRVYGGALSLEEGIDAARERSIGSFRKGIEGGMVAPELSHSLGRGWQIFKRLLPSIDPYFDDRFKTAVGLTTEEYYACWCACITSFLMKKSETTIFDSTILGNNTTQPALVRRLVDLESQTLIELRHALWGSAELDEILARPLPLYDYRPIREKPLLRAEDGRTIVVDPIFVNDKVAVGPLFHVLKGADKQPANQLFADFGIAFERYIQETLRRAFPKPVAGLCDPLFLGLTERTPTDEYELDACLNYVTDLILFEIKGTWQREEELIPDNSASLLQSLRRQYGISEDGNKGAGQLARVADAIARQEWLGPTQEFRQVTRIVPVLVVHDILLGAPGFGVFVASEFDRALGPGERLLTGERLKDAVRLLAPIVLTVEDLELLEVSIEHFSLHAALLNYSEACPDRMTSFRSFLAASAKYSLQLYANRDLASAAMEPIQIAIDRLFSQAPAE